MEDILSGEKVRWKILELYFLSKYWIINCTTQLDGSQKLTLTILTLIHAKMVISTAYLLNNKCKLTNGKEVSWKTGLRYKLNNNLILFFCPCKKYFAYCRKAMQSLGPGIQLFLLKQAKITRNVLLLRGPATQLHCLSLVLCQLCGLECSSQKAHSSLYFVRFHTGAPNW